MEKNRREEMHRWNIKDMGLEKREWSGGEVLLHCLWWDGRPSTLTPSAQAYIDGSTAKCRTESGRTEKIRTQKESGWKLKDHRRSYLYSRS